MTDNEKICAVVVTHNRKNLLSRCLDSLLAQTRGLDKVLVVDNASSDGTDAMIQEYIRQNPVIEYLNLGDNLGGGGGFHYGCRQAVCQGFDWIWLMDDDCVATGECLENLLCHIGDTKHVYSPIIVSIEDGKTILWGIKAKVGSGNREVPTLPFNGFLIHRGSLQMLGYPQKEFFIYGDDTEFNLRAKAKGIKIMMATDSLMYHPYKNEVKGLRIYKMFLNKLWTYYKLRNAIIIYKRYRYISMNQVLMFTAAALFYLLTVNLRFMGLWLQGFKDGVNEKLYVKKILS